MAQTTIRTARSSWTGTAAADKVYINNANKVRVNTGAGNDSVLSVYGDSVSIDGGAGKDTLVTGFGNYNSVIGGAGDDYIENSLGDRCTLSGGAGNDSIWNSGDSVKIDAGDGNDSVYVYSDYTTINGGKGNDTISLNSAAYHNVIQYVAGGGNDTILNWGATDTLSITGGSYTRSTVGNDVVVGVGNDSITIKNAKGKTINIKGTQGGGGSSTTISGGKNISNSKNFTILSGTSSNDTVKNTGTSVRISVGAGNDSIYTTKLATIDAGAGDDTIQNLSAYSSIRGGAGNDYIYSKAGGAFIYGDAGNDTIYVSGQGNYILGGADNDYISVTGSGNRIHGEDGNDTINVASSAAAVTISGGKGNDLIKSNNGVDRTFLYASGDGNDTIENYKGGTISITGAKYTRSTVGSDVVLKVGSGSITVKDGKNKTITVKGTLAGGGSSTTIGGNVGSTLKNTLSNKTIYGTSYADSIYNSSSGNKVTISTGAGNDTITNYGDTVSIDAGAGNDSIYSYSYYSTINGGTGNDIISLSTSGHHNVIQYASGGGNDVLYNLGATDSISITGGTYTRSTVGSDVVLGVGNGSITVNGGATKTVNVIGSLEGGNVGVTIDNTLSNRTLTGTSYADSIRNSGTKVKIYGYEGNDELLSYNDSVTTDGGAGNDTLISTGERSSLSGGAGSDDIRALGNYATAHGGDGDDKLQTDSNYSFLSGEAGNDYIINTGGYGTIYGGAGNDRLNNYSGSGYATGKNNLIDMGAGNDLVSLSGYSPTVTTSNTIIGGAGNDTFYSYGTKNLYKYTAGDGNDVLYNLGATDSISITGAKYTRSTVGSDVVLGVGTGSITVKNGKTKTVNVIPPVPLTVEPNIPTNAYTYNGHSYKIYQGYSSMTWAQAKAYCESLGGHLAVINNAAENTALYSYMKSQGYDSAYFGLSDAAQEGTWTWINGDSSTYRNWASGEPSNGNNADKPENYAMFYWQFTDGKWNDGDFNDYGTDNGGKAFLCEWDTVTTSGGNVGVTINNTLSSRTLTGTAYADSIRNSGTNVTINALDGNDFIYSSNDRYGGAYVTINAGDGNDTIAGRFGDSSISGGAGADLVSMTGDVDRATVNAGTGNDTIYSDNGDGRNIFLYADGDGNDVLYNIGSGDTISITGGTYTRSTVGSDVVLTVGNGSITVKDSKNKSFSVVPIPTVAPVPTVQPVTLPSDNVVYGTSGNDYISVSIAGAVVYAYGGNDTVYNSGHNDVTIYGGEGADSIKVWYADNMSVAGGAGNDKVSSRGNNSIIDGGADNDIIYNSGTGASISGGDGNDSIANYGNNARIFVGNGDDTIYNSGTGASISGDAGNDRIYCAGSNNTILAGNDNDSIYVSSNDNGFVDTGAGNDTIKASYGNNISIKGGAGNDFVSVRGGSYVIAYNSGDGSDTVVGFDGNDTLKVYGSYTRSTVGNDVVVNVGSGSITLKNAKNTSINISNLYGSADLLDSDNFFTGDTRLDSIVDAKATGFTDLTDAFQDVTQLVKQSTLLTFGKK